MSKFQRFYLKEHCYFVTSTIIGNVPVFSDEENARVLVNCMYNFRKQGRYLLLAFVVMPTHFHALLVPNGKYNISQIMHSIKRSSSRLLTLGGKKLGSIWLPSFYEHVIRNKKDFNEKFKYLLANPVKAGLVAKPEEYQFSSAKPVYETDFDKYWVG